jgi:hypothetical protein
MRRSCEAGAVWLALTCLGGLGWAGCGEGGGLPVDPCTPNPCTQVPAPICQDNAVVTFRPMCSDQAGLAICSTAVAQRTDCGALRCDPASATCVACLEDAHCPVAGMRCVERTCVGTCAPDARELNDTPAQASPLRGVEDWPGLTACPDDQDWFRIQLTAGARLQARITFSHAAGDLTLSLLGANASTILATSASLDDDEEIDQVASANGVHYLLVTAAPGQWNAYRLTVEVTGGSDPCMPDPCTAVPPSVCQGEHLVVYQGECREVAGQAECSYPVAGTTDCTSQGSHCHPALLRCTACVLQTHCPAGQTCSNGACQADPCTPSPCTAVPAPECLGETLITYRAECSAATGQAVCTYPVASQTNCAQAGQRCDGPRAACADCLTDADCDGPFEVCSQATCGPGCQDDARESNDGPAEATPITANTALQDLVLCAGDEDWFVFTVQAGEVLSATVAFDGALADLDLFLVAGDGQGVLASATGSASPASLAHSVAQAGTLYLRVVGAGPAQQAIYGLTTSTSGDPCQPNPCTAVPAPICQGQTLVTYRNPGDCSPQGGLPACSYPEADPQDCAATGQFCLPGAPACVTCLSDAHCDWPFQVCAAGACVTGCQDDAFEPNDDTASATGLAPGVLYPDLVLCPASADYFVLILQPGETLRARIEFAHAQGDLSLDILGPDGSTVLAASQTSSDWEEAAASLPGGAANELWVRVRGASPSARNVYSIHAQVLPDPCASNPCTAVPEPACAANRAVTYRAQCTNNLGAAVCSYPVDTAEDCSPTGAVCQAATCVGRFARQGDLAISELMYNPTAAADNLGEWFELRSLAAEPVNLRGLEARDLANNNFTIAVDLLVLPSGFAVLGNNADPATNGGLAVDYVYPSSFALNNSGTETLALRRAGELVDEVGYCIGAAPCISSGVNGISLQLDPLHTDPVSNDLTAYWCVTPAGLTYGAGDRGTPGQANAPCGTRTFVVGWCNVQWPDQPVVAAPGEALAIYSRVWIDGLTNVDPVGVDPAPELVVQVGFGPTSVDPRNDSLDWTWRGAWPNPGWDGQTAGQPHNDEYLGGFSAPTLGQYHFAFRYSGDHGATWTVCDWEGFWDGSGSPLMDVR